MFTGKHLMNRSGPTRQFIVADIKKRTCAPLDAVIQVVNYHYYKVELDSLDWQYYFDYMAPMLAWEVRYYITTCYFPLFQNGFRSKDRRHAKDNRSQKRNQVHSWHSKRLLPNT